MLSVVLWLILCDQVVQCPEHVWVVAVEVALDRTCQNTSLVIHQVCEVDIERAQLELTDTMNLRHIVFVRRHRAGRWLCR